MSFRDGAHNFHIARDGTFLNVQGDHVTNIHQQQLLDPTKILDDARATEAIHKSNTAEYAPKYNPKTRKKVIGDIMKWVERVEAATSQKSILWFDGPAGARKTCIMREVVVRCEASPGMFAVSYFFSTRVNGLSHARPFIATIAHQLVYSEIPGLKTSILQAVSKNPYIFRDGLESQMQALIVEPLQGCGFSNPRFAPRRKVVIVLDGLDECYEEREREHLLKLLLILVNKLSPSLTVIIASRPELDIRTIFTLEGFKAATYPIRLHDYDGRDDVRIFYCDEFEKIRKTHPLRQYIPVGWLTEEILQVLIAKSSGHFIYPSVIMKYIASHPRQNPVQLLEKAMAASSSSDTDNPLADLDALYTLILHPLDVDFPLMKRLLHAIIHTPRGAGDKTPAFFDEFLQLTHGATDAALCDLHSVLRIPTPPFHFGEPNDISFHHKSLEDFLLSSSRSKDLFQSPSDTEIDITLACISLLQSWASNPIKCNPDVLFRATVVCLTFIDKIARCSGQTLPDAILDFDPRCLSEFHFVHLSTPHLHFGIRDLGAVLHKGHCAGRSECTPLCKGLLAIYQSTAKIGRMVSDADSYPREIRLALLPKFKVESGLYSPEAAELSSRPRDSLALLPRFQTETGIYQERQPEQFSAGGNAHVVMPAVVRLAEVIDLTGPSVPSSIPSPIPELSETRRSKSTLSSLGVVELSLKKRKLDSPDRPLGAWDPPKGRLTAKSLFACDYKNRNPDASEKDFERAWRKASKETKAEYGVRANAAREDGGGPLKKRRREQ